MDCFNISDLGQKVQFKNMKQRILLVTPRSPFLKKGACDQDRAYGIEFLISMGFDVEVIVKTSLSEFDKIKEESRRLRIKIVPVSYKSSRSFFKRIWNPLFWDGAAYEYYDREIQNTFEMELENFKPDFVWFDYTYLWPLYKHAKKRGVPIITRSINFEPIHFLQEDGMSFLNLIKFSIKFLSELIAIKKSNFVFSITPKEEHIYKKLGVKNILNLPLRGLPLCLRQEKNIKEKEKIDIFFMGSTYNVSHNKKALEFLVQDIVPSINKIAPRKFIFHILGAKIPKDMEKYFQKNIVYEGYIENLNDFLGDMDIAVVPSLFGAGMQQKIFEPLARGIPTIASSRGIAGYSFKDREHLFLASSKSDFVDAILALRDINLRKKISINSLKLCNEIFARKRIENIILKGLKIQ